MGVKRRPLPDRCAARPRAAAMRAAGAALAAALALFWVADAAAAAAVARALRSGGRAAREEGERRGAVAALPSRVPCACEDAAHCSLPAAAAAKGRREVFGFRTAAPGSSGYTRYDWSRLTTLAWVQPGDEQAACYAHAHGARAVSRAGGINITLLREGDAAALRAVAEAIADDAYARHLDGVNFDWEGPLSYEPSDDAARAAYVRLIAYTAARTRALMSASGNAHAAQTSVDVAWSPSGIDSRFYDNAGLAEAADVVFVMAYDMQSQNMQGRCLAAANSPYELVRAGLQQWVRAVGEPNREKLVLGLPWYGYRYECAALAPAGAADTPPLCVLPSVPFRNVSCSDAAGNEVGYAKILAVKRRAGVAARTDAFSRSPAFETQGTGAGERGELSAPTVTQWWYDDPSSLAEKYALADFMRLGGVGCWNLDSLDPAGHPDDAAAVWSATDGAPRLGDAVGATHSLARTRHQVAT